MNLELLAVQAKTCTACGLAAQRTHVVFGEGNPDARLMIVGEGPGEEEDLQGRPFVGRSGQLLDKILGAVGIRRESVYIANIVKCRPPGNRARGKFFDWQGIKIFPMFHPAYLLRNPSREVGSPKYLTWQDIQMVKKTLDELGPKKDVEVRAASQQPLF
jgi:DNA polymerase